MASKTRPAFPEIRNTAPLTKGESSSDFEHVQSFLERFGYLRTGSYRSGTLDATTSEALRHYQRAHDRRPLGTFNKVTRSEMSTHRCGMPDRQAGLAFTATCPWQKSVVTFAFDTGTSDLPGDTELHAVRRAFATWDAVVPISLREVTTDQSPDIQVGWRPAADPDFDMTGGTLAHADFPPGCSLLGSPNPLPIHFDDSEHRWADGSLPNTFDVETVALHEIGHALGLAHSDVAGAVMFPTIGAGAINRVLQADDVAGIDALYPPP